MERLLDLVSQETKNKLHALLKEQEKVVGLAVSEALKTALSGKAFEEQITEAVGKRVEGIIENYLQWRFEDNEVDYDSEEFDGLRQLVGNEIIRLMKSEKAHKLANTTAKIFIENQFEDDDWLYDHFEDEIQDACRELFREELANLKQNGSPALKKKIREYIEEQVGEDIEEKVSEEDWG
jgi:hypothetical protein